MTDYGFGVSFNDWGRIPAYDPNKSSTWNAKAAIVRNTWLRTGTVPGTKRTITTNKLCLPLFLNYYSLWNTHLPRLNLSTGPLDSWEDRNSRQDPTAVSDHASATACDARYDILLADSRRHMTDAEMRVLDGILALYVTHDGHRVLANGEWWTPGKSCDGMHTELTQGWDRGGTGRNTTEADVAEVIARLHIRPDGTIGTPPPPNPAEGDSMFIVRTANGWVYLLHAGHLYGVSAATWNQVKTTANQLHIDDAAFAKWSATFPPVAGSSL